MLTKKTGTSVGRAADGHMLGLHGDGRCPPPPRMTGRVGKHASELFAVELGGVAAARRRRRHLLREITSCTVETVKCIANMSAASGRQR